MTRVPSSTGSTAIEADPRRTSRGISTSSVTIGGSATPESSVARVRRARSRISPERHEDQAFGAVAFASASVSASSRLERLGVRDPRDHPLHGRGVVGVAGGGRLGEQQVPADQPRDQVDGVGCEAHPLGDRRGRSAPPPRCARSGCPCRCRAAARRPSARRGGPTSRISADASTQVSTTCRSTVNRWIADACGSSRIRSHSGRNRSSAPVSSSVSHTPSRPRPEASSRTSSWRASSGHGSGSGAHSRTRRAAVGGASTTSCSAAIAAARSSSAGSSAGRARRVEHDLAAGQGDAGRERGQAGTAGLAVRRGPGQDGVHAAPGQVGQVRHPPAELADVHLRGAGVGEAEAVREVAPHLGGDPVGRAAGGALHLVADVEQREPGALEVDVRHVDQPGRDQRLEHGRVAQAALGLLDVGHREVRELADQVVPVADQVVQRGQPVARRTPPVGRASSCAAAGSGRGHRRGAGCRAARARPSGRRRPRRPSRGRCAPSGRASRRSPRAGTRPARRPSRTSTPSAETRTTSRSEYGASSARP